MSKIVVLNSGGFDSVVLMKYLNVILEEKEIYSLHFSYGENNEEQQNRCASKIAEEVGAVHKVITLPKIDWSNNDFFNAEGYNKSTQYLEYRNLIFLSYAISYAESIGADKVLVAFLNHNDYPDTTLEFIQGLNFFTEKSGIVIDAPFIFDNKMRLGHIAKYLGITSEDYFSCDVPKPNGEPCGVCSDCLALEEISKKLCK